MHTAFSGKMYSVNRGTKLGETWRCVNQTKASATSIIRKKNRRPPTRSQTGSGQRHFVCLAFTQGGVHFLLRSCIEILKQIQLGLTSRLCTSPRPLASTRSYQGCFRHSWSEIEVSNVPVIDYLSASRESCQGHCSTAGFAYYALEFGFMCSCGSRLPRESSAATDEDCSLVRRTC